MHDIFGVSDPERVDRQLSDVVLLEDIRSAGFSFPPRVNEAPLFPTLRYGRLTDRTPLPQANVHMMIQKRASAAGLKTKISAHSFRATGITTYLQNGGKLEIAQQMAGHESARTTGLYDRRSDEVALDEVERIAY
jgi:integrase/recombinase XerD